MDGLLLFAHGARDPAWAQPFEDVARDIALARPGLPLRLAYLEFMEPGLEQAARALLAQGCSRVHIVPMFLGAGGHVRKDVPALVARLREEFPAVVWTQHPALGDQPLVKRAMAQTSLSFMEN
ncbi:sirohydrochlorin chelatase [Roseateles violae]|uniref:CbiX/SirB N-terminal domain-containing protein n=1 Tax=Roseateles violae TaxID=3058042 RepID=A0ABT8DQ00_9BURK|nr:CbiX/SirB N-terminal domain-containing protein [Pelomonas sp. PFR6]MDN3920425.1 CbiX/SirB N-terminal domain-containing protein [Pelomonas sp. PFR6]